MIAKHPLYNEQELVHHLGKGTALLGTEAAEKPHISSLCRSGAATCMHLPGCSLSLAVLVVNIKLMFGNTQDIRLQKGLWNVRLQVHAAIWAGVTTYIHICISTNLIVYMFSYFLRVGATLLCSHMQQQTRLVCSVWIDDFSVCFKFSEKYLFSFNSPVSMHCMNGPYRQLQGQELKNLFFQCSACFCSSILRRPRIIHAASGGPWG